MPEVGQTVVFKTMEFLNIAVGFAAIVWICIGIKTHASWVQSVFRQESAKISQQNSLIDQYGYGALASRTQLVAKKGFVFGYWDGNDQSDVVSAPSERLQSPLIFKLVNISLVSFTSIAVLIVLGKGLFAGIGIL